MRVTLVYYYIIVKRPYLKILIFLADKISSRMMNIADFFFIFGAKLSTRQGKYEKQLQNIWVAEHEYAMTDEERREYEAIKRNAGV